MTDNITVTKINNMLKTDFTYNQLLEWDKYDLAEHILDLQDKIKDLDAIVGLFSTKTK